MHLWKCCVLTFCFFLRCHGLSCRSEGGYKDADLKKMYNTCLKQQENNSSDKRDSEDWSDRGQIWNYDRKPYRNERMSNRDRNRDENEDRNGMGNRESRGETRDINDRYNMDRRDRNNNMNNKDRNGYGRGDQSIGQNDRLNGRDDFIQSEEFGNDNSRYNYYNQYNRRNKRERRVEMNSGQRSQYNPNSHKTKGSENSNDSRNSSSNSSQAQDKACALHCLMENLHMTGENGMPDRFLVTHTITKDVKNEDLRDFLQESIEECFQILDNENTEDKCEFSKNVLFCLSEKGRANCDDWKDEFQF